jgi:signal transduction histidine kinase
VALTGVTIYGLVRFSSFWPRPIGIDIYMIRSFYLIVFAYIFGFISNFERRQSERLLALFKTASEVAVEEERKRIARELHDRLLQVLATLCIRLETCRNHLLDRSVELEQELHFIEKAARSSMEEIRGFLAGKESDHLLHGTLVESVKEKLKFFRDKLGMKVILELKPEEFQLPHDVEGELHRVLTEGLLNIAKHSHASELVLSLEQTEEEFRGTLRDNGIGFDLITAKKSGFGLTSMNQRVRRMNGEFSLKSAAGMGVEIHFSVPRNPKNF